MKDNFSAQASGYSNFRPDYPGEMIYFVQSIAKHHFAALDVATGNGQVAKQLSAYFAAVYATDISQQQLDNAVRASNIFYRREPAEKSTFSDAQFDLITVGQAVHWFDFDVFYDEVRRILKPDGIFAILGYGLFYTNPDSDRIIRNFYHETLNGYWDIERKYIDENYKTIPFPFDELSVPTFENHLTWSYEQLTGYIETWSAAAHYRKKNGTNPLDVIRDELRKSWEKSDKSVTFPLLLRIGQLK